MQGIEAGPFGTAGHCKQFGGFLGPATVFLLKGSKILKNLDLDSYAKLISKIEKKTKT